MISEGSCDTEDWSNDAEDSVKLQFIIYLHRKCYFKIEKYFPFVLQFLLHFYLINAALVSIRLFFQKQYLIEPKL